MEYIFTEHAKHVIAEREILVAWIERVFFKPEKIETDQKDFTLKHSLGRIHEHGGRVLRVVYNDLTRPKRIVTAYFDRSMRNKL
jgi:hypothetical protein